MSTNQQTDEAADSSEVMRGGGDTIGGEVDET